MKRRTRELRGEASIARSSPPSGRRPVSRGGGGERHTATLSCRICVGQVNIFCMSSVGSLHGCASLELLASWRRVQRHRGRRRHPPDAVGGLPAVAHRPAGVRCGAGRADRAGDPAHGRGPAARGTRAATSPACSPRCRLGSTSSGASRRGRAGRGAAERGGVPAAGRARRARGDGGPPRVRRPRRGRARVRAAGLDYDLVIGHSLAPGRRPARTGWSPSRWRASRSTSRCVPAPARRPAAPHARDLVDVEWYGVPLGYPFDAVRLGVDGGRRR